MQISELKEDRAQSIVGGRNYLTGGSFPLICIMAHFGVNANPSDVLVVGSIRYRLLIMSLIMFAQKSPIISDGF